MCRSGQLLLKARKNACGFGAVHRLGRRRPSAQAILSVEGTLHPRVAHSELSLPLIVSSMRSAGTPLGKTIGNSSFDTPDLPAVFLWFVWLPVFHPDIVQPIVKALCDKIAVPVGLVPVDYPFAGKW